MNRYKRFLADVQLNDGRTVTAHCPNTGSMTNCWKPGAPVQLSYSENPKRKLPWTLERVDMGHGWVGVNTARVNHIVAAAVRLQRIPHLMGYKQMQREPAFEIEGYPRSRFDLLLTAGVAANAYVEVKNTTLLADKAVSFPDAVTERGRKHLELLQQAVKLGFRGVIVYAVNRPEGDYFEPAWDVDPEYGHTLERVVAGGVEVLVVRLKHLADSVTVAGTVSLETTGILP